MTCYIYQYIEQHITLLEKKQLELYTTTPTRPRTKISVTSKYTLLETIQFSSKIIFNLLLKKTSERFQIIKSPSSICISINEYE